MAETTNGRVFTPSEIKKAEEALLKLAEISADFWKDALLSKDFVLNGKILDYERGYKDRVQKILETKDTRDVSKEEADNFKKNYLKLAQKKIVEILKEDKEVAAVLGEMDRVKLSAYGSFSDFNFGGWDNDATGEVAYAMKAAGIKGYMHYGSRYRKKYITLLKEDGSIRVGWYRWCTLLGSTR